MFQFTGHVSTSVIEAIDSIQKAKKQEVEVRLRRDGLQVYLPEDVWSWPRLMGVEDVVAALQERGVQVY